MSEDSDGIKSGLGCLLGFVAMLFVVALFVGAVTGKTSKTLAMAKEGSETLIGVVIIGFVLVALMMLITRKK